MAERPILDPGRIPGPVYIPDGAEWKLHWTLANGKPATNVLHARASSFPTDASTLVQSAFTGIKAALTSSGLLTALWTGTRLDAVSVRNMEDAGGSVGYAENRSSGTALAGSNGEGHPMPFQVAFVVTLKTPYSGQGNRGRVYIPGFSTDAADTPGTIKETHAQDAVDFITGIKNYLGGIGHELGIAHPARQQYEGLTGANHPARGASIVSVLTCNYQNLNWDTQRLRAIN